MKTLPYKLIEDVAVQLVLTGPGQGGILRYAHGLERALRELGVNVRSATRKGPPIPRGLAWLARRVGYDLTTFFTTYPPALPPGTCRRGQVVHLLAQREAVALAFGRRVPASVVTVHDLITVQFHNRPELAGVMKSHDKLFEKIAARGLRRAARLIADSEHTRQDIIRYLGYPAEKIQVVYIGVDHDEFRPREVELAFYARHGLQREAPYVLYVGADDPRKNLPRLIQAFSKVTVRVPEARLLKVGALRTAAAAAQLSELIAREGLQGKVVLCNEVSDGDLAKFYSLATVFVFPSLYEGFGLPPLEAMACGAPVVASNATSLPEVVGDAGLLTDPCDPDDMAEKILRVLEKQDLRACLRQRGFEQAAKFTWEKTASQTMAVYRQLL